MMILNLHILQNTYVNWPLFFTILVKACNFLENLEQ